MRIADLPIIAEIKEEYEKYRRKGFSREDSVSQLKSCYYSELVMGNDDDGLLFWIGVADAQYACAELSQEVAQKGLTAISVVEGADWNINPNDLSCRRKHYLAAPMPEQILFKRIKKYRCTWNVGDTFAYRLSGDDAKECGLEGRNILLRTIDTLEFGDGRLLPVVTFTMWDNKPLPKSSESFQRLPVLKLVNGRLGLPKSLYEYRAELLITSEKKIDKMSLVYLGNFQDVAMPEDEVIIRDAGTITMVVPERLDWYSCIFWKRNNNHCEY